MASGIIDNHFTWSSFDVGINSGTAGNREDLLDIITITSPTETPFLSGLRKTVANGTTHQWLIDSLSSFGDPDVGNADVSVTPESFDAIFTSPVNRKRLLNYTHIFRKTVDVSDTQRAVNTAGIQDEYIYQLRKIILELAREIEFGLVHSVLSNQTVVGNVGGTPAVGRQMEGILRYLEPDPAGVSADYLTSDEEGTITEAGSPCAQLSETIYNDHMQASWTKGIIYKTAYCNAAQKREISAFSANVTRNVDATTNQLVANIDVYEGDFGMQAVVLHRYMPTCEVLTLDEDYWRIAILRPILAVELARAGNSTRAMVEAELTLESLAPSTGGKIVWLTNGFNSDECCAATSGD